MHKKTSPPEASIKLTNTALTLQVTIIKSQTERTTMTASTIHSIIPQFTRKIGKTAQTYNNTFQNLTKAYKACHFQIMSSLLTIKTRYSGKGFSVASCNWGSAM